VIPSLQTDVFVSQAAFYAGLIFLVLGTGLLKPAMLVLLGSLFAPADPRRAAAFNYYYMAINVGGLVAGLAVGTAAERLGWHYGFGLAGLGMVMGLGLFVGLAPRVLDGRHRVDQAGEHAGAAGQTSHSERRRLWLIAVAAIFVVLYVVGWYQGLGLWLLFIRSSIDRTVAGFEVPATWFASFNPALILLLSPIVAAIWVKLANRGIHVHFLSKFIVAFFLLASAHLAMFVAASTRSALGAPGAGLGWPGYAYLTMTLGEVILWPTTYGMVHTLAPPRLRAFLMGAWHATLGVGSWLAGLVGAQAERIGSATTFLSLAVGMAGLGATLLLLAGRLRRLEPPADSPGLEAKPAATSGGSDR
jgi:POT family proton-dependent oligopeptide transporter